MNVNINFDFTQSCLEIDFDAVGNNFLKIRLNEIYTKPEIDSDSEQEKQRRDGGDARLSTNRKSVRLKKEKKAFKLSIDFFSISVYS